MARDTQTIRSGTESGVSLLSWQAHDQGHVGKECGGRFAHHLLRIAAGAGITATVDVLVNEIYVTLVISAAGGTLTLMLRPESTLDLSGTATAKLGGRWRDVRITWSGSHADNALSWESWPAGGAI